MESVFHFDVKVQSWFYSSGPSVANAATPSKIQKKMMVKIICDSTIFQKRAVWKLFCFLLVEHGLGQKLKDSFFFFFAVIAQKRMISICTFLNVCMCTAPGGKLMLLCQCCEWVVCWKVTSAKSSQIFPNTAVKPVLSSAACLDLIPDVPHDYSNHFLITKSKNIFHKSLCTENVVIANNGHLKEWKRKAPVQLL